MPSKIVWLPSASKDLDRLKSFIKSKNPLAAQRAARRIMEGAKLLEDNPKAGFPVENLTGYHDLRLAFVSGEYVLRYRSEKD